MIAKIWKQVEELNCLAPLASPKLADEVQNTFEHLHFWVELSK